jgi:hypothetical protein
VPGFCLCSQEKVKVAVVRGSTADEVAARFQVSVEMASWRMRMSGGEAIRERLRRKWSSTG